MASEPILYLSDQMEVVVRALLNAPDNEVYGMQIINEPGLYRSAVYKLLRQLERQRIVTSRLEDAGVRRGRRRCYFKLTPEGKERVQAALNRSAWR